MTDEDNEDQNLYEYIIYDSQTGDCLDIIIIDRNLGDSPEVEISLVRIIKNKEDYENT